MFSAHILCTGTPCWMWQHCEGCSHARVCGVIDCFAVAAFFECLWSILKSHNKGETVPNMIDSSTDNKKIGL